MIMRLLTFLAIVTAVYCASEPVRINATQHAYQDGKVMKVPLNETGSDELLGKWLGQAVSGLMAAVASKRLHQMDEDSRSEIEVCSKNANSVPEHARCIVKVLDQTKNIKTAVPVKDTPASHLKNKPLKAVKISMSSERMNAEKNVEDLEWKGAFGQARMKRQTNMKIINSDSYKLKTKFDASPMKTVLKQLTKNVRIINDKSGEAPGWKKTLERVQGLGKKAKETEERRKAMQKKLKMFINNTPDNFQDPRKIKALHDMEMEDEELSAKKAMGKEKANELRVPLQVVREAIKTAMQMAGKNTTDFDKKTLKLASPRMFSVVPEQEDDSLFNLLSPSLFSLHDQGTDEEQKLSLPSLLKGLEKNDQEAWLDFVMEAAGVDGMIEKAENAQQDSRDQEMRGTGGVPLHFTKKNVTDTLGDHETRKIEVFEKLDQTYNQKQRSELDQNGYSVLTPKQIRTLYGTNSPYNNTETMKRLLKVSGRLRDDPHHLMERDFRVLAEVEKFEMRHHDIVGSPFIKMPLTFQSVALSQPIILSPLVLSPITLSPAVLGPIILSPWVFIPLVLSPRVLSPLILTPLVFSPIILSPLVLHPLILVPGVFNPVILSPLVLSPLILSPQVFSPLILSPFVLNPLILTPMVGSPLILSPFALSPIILSPQALFAVVLSPYALSPLIESKLIASEIVLSPSWLS